MSRNHLVFCLPHNKIKVTPGRWLPNSLFKIHDNGGFESFWDQILYRLTVLVYRKLVYDWRCIFFLQLKLSSHHILTQISKAIFSLFFLSFFFCTTPSHTSSHTYLYQIPVLWAFPAGSCSPVLCIICLLFSRLLVLHISCTHAKARHSVEM